MYPQFRCTKRQCEYLLCSLLLAITCTVIVLFVFIAFACSTKTYDPKILVIGGADVIWKSICERIKEAYFFTVIGDESTDNGKKEQLCICLRYVYRACLREEFLLLCEINDMTGRGIANKILSELQKLNIDLSGLVGLGFDGASAMKGQFNGAQAVLRDLLHQYILYVHCAAHCLNLSLTKASDVRAITNAWGKLSEIINFFNGSALRIGQLAKCVGHLNLDSKKERLPTLCDTRWVERHNSVHCAVLLWPGIIAALEDISGWNNSGNAQTLLDSINSEFLVSLATLNLVLIQTKTLSVQLQASDIDLIGATDLISSVQEKLQEFRNNSEDTFAKVFEEAEALGRAAGIDSITLPRLTGRQRNRDNVPHSSPRDYFRKVCLLPFLDNILAQLKQRFGPHFKIASGFQAIIPAKMLIGDEGRYDFEDLLDSAMHFIDLLPAVSEAELRASYESWVAHWQRRKPSDRPTDLCSTLASKEWEPSCHKTIDRMLRIFATLPVSTATGERAFSTLDHLKNYKRSTMGEPRLNGLSLLYIHPKESENKE